LLEEIGQECVVSGRGRFDFSTLARVAILNFIKNPEIKPEKVEFCKYIEVLK